MSTRVPPPNSKKTGSPPPDEPPEPTFRQWRKGRAPFTPISWTELLTPNLSLAACLKASQAHRIATNSGALVPRPANRCKVWVPRRLKYRPRRRRAARDTAVLRAAREREYREALTWL